MNEKIYKVEAVIPRVDVDEWLASFPSKSDVVQIDWFMIEDGIVQITMLVEQTPPIQAVYLLYFFLSKKNREPLVGDLQEEYKEFHARFGARPANVWFWKQVLLSLCPLWNGWFLKYGARLGEWSKGILAEAMKRRMS